MHLGFLMGFTSIRKGDKMRKLNMYFFGEEEISCHDAGWFYGMLSGSAILTAIVWVVAL